MGFPSVVMITMLIFSVDGSETNMSVVMISMVPTMTTLEVGVFVCAVNCKSCRYHMVTVSLTSLVK